MYYLWLSDASEIRLVLQIWRRVIFAVLSQSAKTANTMRLEIRYHQTISQYMEKTVRLLCLKCQEVQSSPAVRLPSRLWARLHLEFVVKTSSSQSRVTQSGLKPYAHLKFAAPFKRLENTVMCLRKLGLFASE